MVKLLTLIFAFYIVLLPCLPCADKEACTDNIQTAVSSSSTDHDHTDETCNPFCSCACCGSIFIQNFQLNKVAVANAFQYEKSQFFYNNISLPSNFFGNIWQPPKFS